MRRFLVLSLFAGAVTFGAPAALACHLQTPWLWYCTFEHFSGNAHVNCFGCGVPSPGHADLDFLGGGSGYADFTANEPGGALCLVTGTAFGHVTLYSGMEFDFTWSRVGATAMITTSGDRTGVGVGTLVAPGVACGGPLDATVTGVLVG